MKNENMPNPHAFDMALYIITSLYSAENVDIEVIGEMAEKDAKEAIVRLIIDEDGNNWIDETKKVFYTSLKLCKSDEERTHYITVFVFMLAYNCRAFFDEEYKYSTKDIRGYI